MRFPAKIMRGERPPSSLHTSHYPAKIMRGERPPSSLHTSHYPAKTMRGERPLRKWPLMESSATA